MNIEVKNAVNLIDYIESMKVLEQRVEDVISGKKKELLWVIEHHHVYTAGTSSNKTDLLDKKINVIKSNRGGKYTYHGPGQKIIYLMINLNQRNKDVKEFITLIENIILKILERFGICGVLDHKHHGIFIRKDDGNLYKIASIGIKFKKWVSYHGFSFNLNPNLEHYSGINPCGLSNQNVTSLSDIGIEVDNKKFDDIVIEEINNIFDK